MKKILDKLGTTYHLTNEDSAFEMLSGVVILKKSATYLFSRSWIKKKIKNGTYSNDCNDGKIDLIDYEIDTNKENITFSFVQVQNSSSMSQDKIELFVNSVNQYFIEDHEIAENSNYKALIPYQKRIREEVEKYHNYKKQYQLYVSYYGKKEQHIYTVLDSSIQKLKLENVSFEVFDKEKIEQSLIELQAKINHSSDVSYNVKSSENAISVTKGDFCSVTMMLNSDEIKKMINEELNHNIELNRLFNNNVRGFLVQSDVNQQIKDTIENYPDSFYFCNNGATIFCDELIKNNNREINIVNPRILNGQQSIASIYLYDRFGKVSIGVKFITTKMKSKEKRNMQMNLICKTTNTSNPITPINLISNSTLFVSMKNLFESHNITLNLKQGELINSIFSKDDHAVELEELLKMWATIFLERPDYAKQYTKIAKIFYKSELEDEKYVVFQDKNIIKIVEEEFLNAYHFFEKVSPILTKFRQFDYYSHAYFFLAFKIYKDYGFGFIVEDVDVETIEKEVEQAISQYKKECEADNKSYSLNNYFKSRAPILDFGYEIKTERDKMEELLKQKEEVVTC